MRDLKKEIHAELMTAHIGHVTAYMWSHRVKTFSAPRYERSLRRQPEVLCDVVEQSREEIHQAFDKVLETLQPFGFGCSHLAQAVEEGFTPSVWKNFPAAIAGSCETAKALSRYPINKKHNMNPAGFISHALLSDKLRRMRSRDLLRKLDESIAFDVKHGAARSAALLARARNPHLFEIGKEEIESHLQAMQEHFGDSGYDRGRYLKALYRPNLNYSRNLSRGPAEISAHVEGVMGAFGPYGLGKKAWFSAIMQYPFLLLHDSEEMVGRVDTMARRLQQHGVGRKECLEAYACSPYLFARDPQTICERIETLHENFSAHGLTARRILTGHCQLSALAKVKTSALVTNISAMQAYLEERGDNPAPYFNLLANSMDLALLPAMRQQDNYRIMKSSYDEGLFRPPEAVMGPAEAALHAWQPLVRTGQDLALRRLWARTCKPGAASHAVFRGSREAVLTDLRNTLGVDVDINCLIRRELETLEKRLGVPFSPYAFGGTTGATTCPPRREKRQLASTGPV